MDIKKIKKLITLVETSDISSLCVEEDQLKIEIKKESPNQVIQTTAAALPIEKPTPIAQESVKTETPNTPSN